MDNLLPEYYAFIGHNKIDALDFCRYVSKMYGISPPLKLDIISQAKYKKDSGDPLYYTPKNYKIYIAHLPNSLLEKEPGIKSQMYFADRKVVLNEMNKEINRKNTIMAKLGKRKINKLALNSSSKIARAMKAVKAAKPARRKIKIEKDA